MTAGHGWQSVLPGIELFRDSCNVYAVSGPEGTVFINAGTGHWLDAIPPASPRPSRSSPPTISATTPPARPRPRGWDSTCGRPPARLRSSPTRSSISASGRATSSTTISGTSSLRSNRRRSRRLSTTRRSTLPAWSLPSSPSPASRRTTPATRSRRPRAAPWSSPARRSTRRDGWPASRRSSTTTTTSAAR